jgi:hypothetical protein
MIWIQVALLAATCAAAVAAGMYVRQARELAVRAAMAAVRAKQAAEYAERVVAGVPDGGA